MGEDTDSVGWNTSVSSDVRRIHVDRRWGDEPNANRFTISVPFRRHYVVLNGLAPRAGKDFQLAGDLDCDDCSGWSVECSGCQVSVREARKEFRLSTDPVIPAKNGQTAGKIGSCLVKGAVVGAVGALAVGGLAVGAVTLGAPVAIVTGVLGVAAAVGGGFTLYDTAQQASNGNWAGVAYNVGTIGGSAVAGGATSSWVRTGITGETSGWNIGKDWQQGYRPNYPGGSFSKWLGTGPNVGSAGGATAAVGAGVSKVVNFFTSGC